MMGIPHWRHWTGFLVLGSFSPLDAVDVLGDGDIYGWVEQGNGELLEEK
jgi:hypothetical protein